MRKTSPRLAFTLVEMLVVISIISILLAVLLPAVGAARAAMQRSKCQNNLKQLALALLSYESVHQAFPPGEVHGSSSEQGYSASGSGNANHCNWDRRIGMWLNAIYPQLEMDNYYDSFNFSATPQYSDPNNRIEMRRFFDLFHCPSDPVRDELTTAWGDGGEDNRCNMLNYFAVGGSTLGSNVPHTDNSAANADPLCNMTNGMFYNDSKVRLGAVRDGTSYTAMLAETWGRIYPNHYAGEAPHPLGYPTQESSRGMNGQAYVFFDYPPNSDDPRLNPATHKIPQAERGSPNRVKSFHTGGAHIASVDGSVHFVNESIQFKVNVSGSNYDPGVWQFLATIDGRDVVNPKFLNWK